MRAVMSVPLRRGFPMRRSSRTGRDMRRGQASATVSAGGSTTRPTPVYFFGQALTIAWTSTVDDARRLPVAAPPATSAAVTVAAAAIRGRVRRPTDEVDMSMLLGGGGSDGPEAGRVLPLATRPAPADRRHPAAVLSTAGASPVSGVIRAREVTAGGRGRTSRSAAVVLDGVLVAEGVDDDHGDAVLPHGLGLTRGNGHRVGAAEDAG